MKKLCVTVLFAASLAASALGDYPADRKAAMDLLSAGKTADAQAAFEKLAAGDVTELQKADALEQAARCAVRLNQFDRAMQTALHIPVKPASIIVQMEILDQQHKSADIVAKFKDEDLDAWPDQYKGAGFFARGQAAMYQKNGALAEADLKKAIQFLTDDNMKGEAINGLGDTYRTVLKDDAKAVETYRRVFQTRNEFKHAHAAINLAVIFAAQKDFDGAFAELGKVKMDQMKPVPYWHASMLMAYGATYAAQGKRPEAIARYQEALKLPGIAAYQKTACEKAIQALQAP